MLPFGDPWTEWECVHHTVFRLVYQKAHHRKSSALDRNVIEMEPEFSPHYFSPKARSVLKGLMAKNPPTRLGYHNILDIKEHPWFDEVDFGLLEAGYLKPPFDPPKVCKRLNPQRLCTETQCCFGPIESAKSHHPLSVAVLSTLCSIWKTPSDFM